MVIQINPLWAAFSEVVDFLCMFHSKFINDYREWDMIQSKTSIGGPCGVSAPQRTMLKVYWQKEAQVRIEQQVCPFNISSRDAEEMEAGNNLCVELTEVT